MELKTYSISNTFIHKTKCTYLYLLIFMPIGILLSAFCILFFNKESALTNLPLLIGVFIAIALFLEIEILVVSKIMLRKVTQNKLILGEDFLQRGAKKMEPPIYFKDITKLHIKKEVSGEISYITIYCGNKSIRLFGFEELEAIATLLITSAPQAKLKENSLKLDYNHPVIWGLMFFLILGVIYIFDFGFSLPISNIMMLFFATWFLFFKPISKAQGKRFRLLELICGGLIFIGAIMSFID